MSVRKPRFLSLLVFAAVLASCESAMAISLSGPDFFISTRGTKVASVLEDFGANYGVPVIVSREIDDIFVGTLSGLKADATLDQLAKLYNLAWYYDGRALYVYKANEVTSDVLTPGYLRAEDLSGYLEEAGVLDRHYCSLKVINDSNALEVFGVPVCVARVKQIAKSMDDRMLDQAQNQEAVQIFPLRYASASDGSYVYRSQTVVVPGVVSELREMSQNRSLPVSSEGGKTLASKASLPTFAADSSRNAVIIRDRKANMELYADLIRQLDQRPIQIEISVAIIDVDAGDVKSLGVDLSGSLTFGGATVNVNPGGAASDGTFSTTVSNSDDFFVRINALARTSHAKVLSRPSIVTLNNVQAVLDRSVTFYTKVEGKNVAQLASVASGSLLRVTPRLIKGDFGDEIMLTLDLQDGREEPPVSNTEAIPQVLNSGIATQAILRTGQSLLLGGFVQDNERQGTRKIPLLGDIPILGRLFSSNASERRSVVRLFLIKAEPRSLT